ncbi:General negative regulator of transcription subunit 4 [Colletotrichum chlorophyti]|uniref:General negative regulator of transcription subunit 4 n=1 Tax=Colletotrichum chlorophyti TaxID=708187 RepID=A0A1Q8RLI8_9PEZI|nr:General negative regulator of transcription subunit 4 [Colletotrichum chlorophyti]
MAPQDSFIEEEEDTCPLCIEEFDLSDRNFRPCPCGYQVCQFCFNNIKNNMNGLCPACRRPYDEKTIQWKVVTTEEVAEFRANIKQNQKKRAADQKQKEQQKREVEKENRKNLVGVRVVQKNLVYVTGLTPTVREDELLKTLRKPEFFGQYGNIQKISISNRKSSDGQNQSLGIYVTFEKKEDAQRCIQAVNGSQNGDRALLKAMQGCPFTYVSPESNGLETIYPPMFDSRGGEKRRAMREEEEARLELDQEQQSDAQEASEGEPETGGSLALGGEPEDRDAAREAGFEQRRPGTQPPIQRNNTEGLFGPALGSGFSQASVSGGSVAGSRSMTPQQQLFVRSQSGFGDHLPPGIATAQPSTAQQQSGGHNRQGSRFSFANDSTTTSASVKVAANPRIMAQQTAMMPSNFHSQPGSQYYASSMPGPPPGLKSTGTPPSMFGQGHSFSGGFGAASKDSAELLQTLIRGRGANGQGHDAGKREYMLSSFSNQYPSSTSSTPAPASGLLASLYGNQPGAFQDFGPKQKKKGKKHRHANTSSSGGGGLVDLADPSILQARMQHQSQSNAGVGQGLFGGQSQGGYNPNMMYNTRFPGGGW